MQFLRHKIIGAPKKLKKTGRLPYLGLELTVLFSKAKSISRDSPLSENIFAGRLSSPGQL
jgi:hypothetical protein